MRKLKQDIETKSVELGGGWGGGWGVDDFDHLSARFFGNWLALIQD